jgi:hypothetical protein
MGRMEWAVIAIIALAVIGPMLILLIRWGS